jgi:probable selenate reductase FAD-binding subunit
MSYPKQISKTIRRFDYLSASNIEQVIAYLKEYGSEAKLLAGGTDVLVLMKHRALTPKHVIGIKGLDLNFIKLEDNLLRIGALTTVNSIMESDLIKEKYVALFEAAKVFATPQVRNIATIGGNICRSSPSADMVCPLIALDAQVKLVGANGSRVVDLKDFFVGPGKNILDNEILTEVIIPLENKPYGTAFCKLSRNSADLSKVNCAVKIVSVDGECKDIKISLGAVAATPVRVKSVEEAIKNQKITDELLEKVVAKVGQDIAPISDARSKAEYRIDASQVLVKRMIKQAFERSENK